MANTRWVPVRGWEGLYEVSSEGAVRHANGRAVTITSGTKGYRTMRLARPGEPPLMARVARVVTAAFHGEAPSPTHQANHRNGDHADDRAENLEWATPSENCAHAYRVLGIIKPRGVGHYAARLTEAQVIEARAMATLGMAHSEIGRHFGVARQTIWNAVSGRNWKHLRSQ